MNDKELATSNGMNSQTRLLTILIICVGFIAGYAIYSGSSAGNSGIAPLVTDAKDTLNQFQNIHFNFSVFDSADLKALRTFGELPVRAGATGKTDLFASF